MGEQTFINIYATNEKMTNQEMRQKMELQLHEQYAVNNNANLSSIIALLVGMFVAIGAYGYVFLHCTDAFEYEYCSDILPYSLTQLCYALIGTILVISIMMYLCIYQGSAQRYEQFIIHKIRVKYKMISETNSIFPSTYTPYNKRGLHIVQGLYGEFVKIFAVIEIFIVVSWLFKILENIYKYHQNGVFSAALLLSIATIIIVIVMGIFCFHFLFERENRYLKEANLFEQYKKELFWSKHTYRQLTKTLFFIFRWNNRRT